MAKTPEFTEYQRNLLKKVNYIETMKMGEKTTVALLKLHNGFEVVGTSACVDPAMFDVELGKHYATVDALSKLDQFVGFAITEERHKEDPRRWDNYKDSAGQ